ncbi:MAG: cellulase family glycosylhydrolase [Micromonosporaceae bacterium]|nr:cellulase family glycosylhydrolase [Micromonosporaceae bacterium]
MWGRYDSATVTKELQVLADHGLTLTRSFFYWPELMPTPYRLDDEVLNRFGNFLDLHAEQGLRTVPTLVVGHMSGENWDPAWRDGRDLYSDVWLVGRQAWMAERIARRFAGHPAVAGWLLSNEMPIYGGWGTPEAVTSWAQLLIQGLRAGGATQPVSIGDGAWTIEVSGRESGYRLADLAPLIDWIGPHVYPMGDDQVRQHLRAAFLCELAGTAPPGPQGQPPVHRPVILEEFGASSDFVSDQNVGHYYRQLLHTSLLAGATGWVAWNNTDFDDLADEAPYSHHPFEMHFGITDNNGTPKASLREMAEFRKVLDAVEVHRCIRAPSEVGIVIGSHVDSVYPFTDARERPVALGAIEQAYLACREAAVPAGLIRERSGIGTETGGGDCRLYLLPSTKQLTAPGWRRLEELAHAGATVYVSYCAGGTDNQRGPWYAGVDRLFGVRHQLRYGLVDPIGSDPVRLTLRESLGNLAAGTELEFAVGGPDSLRTYLPVEPVEARVLATDAQGRPALLSRAVGAGAMVLCTYPLEAMAAATARVNPEPTWRLYAALAQAAGAHPQATVDDPQVLVDCLDRDDGARFVWLVSQTGAPLAVTPRAAGGQPLHDLETGVEVSTVELPPFGVRVLRGTAG